MEPIHPPQTLESNAEAVDVTSWLSVCPSGLWKVQQKLMHVESQQAVSNSGNFTCMILLSMFVHICETLEYFTPCICFSSLLACSSSYCPRLGSLCRVRVRLKANTDEADTERTDDEVSAQPDQTFNDVTESVPTPFQRCLDSVLQVPLGDWTTLRLGEGQCDITEACVEGMKAGEKCEVRVYMRCLSSGVFYYLIADKLVTKL